jgi:alkylation response protein AidB-like acyl-CoA dehydrogenase
MAGSEHADDEALSLLAGRANLADANAVWPTESWEAVRRLGGLGWAIPTAYGGLGIDAVEMLQYYELLAGSCLTTCFILSQRDAAVRRIRDSGNEALCRELLRPLACGGRFATVGIAQLTTSRQHQKPAMVVRETATGFVFDGFMPWVTGAAQADHLIAGAVLEDGRQILVAMPCDLPGIHVGPPLELMALQGSLTAEVRCANVALDRRWLLAGPAEKVMTSGRGGTGGLETSCLALGLAGAAVDYLNQEATARPELAASCRRLEQVRQGLRQELHRLVREGSSAEAAATLRGRANTLVLRATQTALTASKGTGFLRQHPAQRWARQALFFLVWSCPRPVAEATLAYLTPPGDHECTW